jgi:hypothetical protein
MQQNVAGLYELLQFGGGGAGQRDAVVVTERDHRVAMRVSGDERLQFLHSLCVGEMIEFDRVVLWIEVDDSVGTDARLEDEVIVARPADRNRYGLVEILGGILRIGDADVVRLGQCLSGRQVHLIIAEREFEAERRAAIAVGHRIEGEGADIAGAIGRDARTQCVIGTRIHERNVAAWACRNR